MGKFFARMFSAALTAALLGTILGCTREPEKLPTVPTTEPVWTTAPETVPVTLPPETVDAEAVKNEALVMQQAPAAVHTTSVEAPGTLVKEGGGAVIDYSNTRQGYVMVQHPGPSDRRLKVQVKGPATTYTYNLTPQRWTAFPLSDQEGHYQIVVYQNIEGSRYAALLSLSVEVTLENEFAPFLHSNQYVDYDAAPKTVAKAAQLTGNLTDTLEKVSVIYDYVVGTLSYDKELAATVKSGYLPDLDAVLERRAGICFDYAALMTAMLRSQGIPAKLVVGYAGQSYHAWISVWTESTGWVDGVIYFDGSKWQRMDPTFASSANGSKEIMAFIGDGENYTAKYFY